MKTDEIREKDPEGYLIYPTKFYSKGFNFSLVKREGKIAIYKKCVKKTKCCHFEVVIIEKREEYEMAGNVFPKAEVYPSDNQWGIKGFTYTLREQADNKFLELTEEQKSEKIEE